MTESSACSICAVIRGEGPPSGWVYRDEQWAAFVLPGFEVPGWIAVGTRRHAEGIGSMNADEASAFGGVLVDVSNAIRDATGAERVYMIGLGELHAHWHVMLAARGAEVPMDQRGLRLLERREELLDATTAVAVANQVKELLGG